MEKLTGRSSWPSSNKSKFLLYRREIDDRLKARSKDKMARLKELMILHMNSTGDAFKLVTFTSF